MLRTVCSGIAILFLMHITSGAYAQLPVVPGAAGFGMETPAGRGGEIYRVTNLNDSGAGSLRDCVEGSGARVCIFEVSGTIRLKSNLSAKSPNLTIAGQSAPQPGIMLRGASLVIKASDVLVQHIAVRAGDDPDGPAPHSRDSIKINGTNPVRNVVIDHCSVSWGIDENMSAFGDIDNVTVSNTIISEPLNESQHTKGSHGYGMLIASDSRGSKVSFIGNLFAHSVARNPRSNASDFVFANNVVYNTGAASIMLYNTSNMTSDNSIVGNVFVDGADTTAAPIRIAGSAEGNGDSEILLGTQLYLSDNFADGTASDSWSIVYNKGNLTEAQLRANSAPSWPSGLTVWPTGGGVALSEVLDRAGSRPAQRGAVDAGIVADVRNGTGRIINCVSADGSSRCQRNAGGWPDLASNSRTLDIPSNPSGDDDGDGYTNLEEWLHAMAADVEGRSGTEQASTAKPLPPVFLE